MTNETMLKILTKGKADKVIAGKGKMLIFMNSNPVYCYYTGFMTSDTFNIDIKNLKKVLQLDKKRRIQNWIYCKGKYF